MYSVSMDWQWVYKVFDWTAVREEHPVFTQWMTVCAILTVTHAAVRILRKIVPPILHRSLNRQMASLLCNTVFTAIWVFSGIQVLSVLGVDVISILGAAGVAGIAIGFASQTTLSNLISGIFIVGEKSIKPGDWVQLQGYSGTIESIDLLSLKIREADNSLVRIPNESLIKNPVKNVTEAKLRRCDFDIGVDYSADLEKVEKIILKIAEEQPTLLKKPMPTVQFVAFADSALTLHVGAWCRTTDYRQARLEFARRLLASFQNEGINIPYPIQTIMVSPAEKETTSELSDSTSQKNIHS